MTAGAIAIPGDPEAIAAAIGQNLDALADAPALLAAPADAGRAESGPDQRYTLVSSGRVAGLAELDLVPHPQGLAGRCARLGLRLPPPQSEGPVLESLLGALVTAVREAGVAETLLAGEPAPEALDEALSRALEAVGFGAVPEAPGGRLLELTSRFWRQGGVYVIAEAGSNWRLGSPQRDLSMAMALIDVAAEAGADAVKFQTFQPQSIYVENAGASDYLSAIGITTTIRDIFADLAMPHEMIPKLAEHAATRGIDFLSTAFSLDDFAVVDPHVPVHKIASYEISHPRLIEAAARSGKPTLMSTGAASLDDIAWAVDRFHAEGGRDLCLLQCTAKYPSPASALNLAVLPELARRFGVPVGLSDHSRDPVAGPAAASSLGARVVEKHFTLDNRLPGPDHPFAVTPEELARLVVAVRAAAETLGSGVKAVQSVEAELAAYAQRGIQATREICNGEPLREGDNIAILRPGKQTKGLHPRHLAKMEGRTARRRIPLGDGIRWGDWVE